MKIKFLINYILFYSNICLFKFEGRNNFFDSKNIKIEENGNMIFATKGKAKIPSNNLIIEGDKFIYDKKISELIVFDDVKYFDNKIIYILKVKKLYIMKLKNTILSKNQTFIKIK